MPSGALQRPEAKRHLVKANADMPPEDGTGWNRHDCDFQIVIMMKGWARFMYEDKPTLVQAGDVVHQRPGIVHYLFDYSPDMEYLEIVKPGGFKDGRHAACNRQGAAGDALEITLGAEVGINVSSAVGGVAPSMRKLDLVCRARPGPISSREHRRTRRFD